MTTTTTSLSHLGYAIAAEGITADPVSLDLLASDARELGVNDVLVAVMVDDRQPSVARVRAFARVSSAVANELTDAMPRRYERELAHAC
jgi:hypothetical protein